MLVPLAPLSCRCRQQPPPLFRRRCAFAFFLLHTRPARDGDPFFMLRPSFALCRDGSFAIFLFSPLVVVFCCHPLITHQSFLRCGHLLCSVAMGPSPFFLCPVWLSCVCCYPFVAILASRTNLFAAHLHYYHRGALHRVPHHSRQWFTTLI